MFELPSSRAMEAPAEDRVKVVVRARPLTDHEVASGHSLCVYVDEDVGQITVSHKNKEEMPKQYSFDYTFGTSSRQADIFNKVARPIVDSAMEGYNGTIFAYGQTGTGKTYTMEGVRNQPELRGIIPNSFAHIFARISKAKSDVRFLVHVSYFEIYNEEVRDLLSGDQTGVLEVKERPDVGVYIKDLSKFVVNNADHMDKIMTLGNRNRMVGPTNMNLHSSRSHAVFTITIECSDMGPDNCQRVRIGKLNLVDLAGSERQSKTGSTGIRFTEAKKINLSLSTLGKVISTLVDPKSTHVPYRNSKLTRILQDSLGGNSKTAMIANVGPADYNYDETLNTLRYANQTKNIKNKPRVNEDPKDALLRQYQTQIEELRRKLNDESVDLSGPKVAKSQILDIQAEIDADRRMLEARKNMAEEERNRITRNLQLKEKELKNAEAEQRFLLDELSQLEKKVIVGGVNLMEKAEEQERLLDESARNLEERRVHEAILRQKLVEKEQERVDMEGKYSCLQEEVDSKTKRIQKVWNQLMQVKSEMEDCEDSHRRDIDEMVENCRQLCMELKFQMLLIDSYIPAEYQELITANARWDNEIGEWVLKGIAYTGNNMPRQPEEEERMDQKAIEAMSCVYIAYPRDKSDFSKKIRVKQNK